MLQSLHVHNFALLEDAYADFTPASMFLQVKPVPANLF